MFSGEEGETTRVSKAFERFCEQLPDDGGCLEALTPLPWPGRFVCPDERLLRHLHESSYRFDRRVKEDE